MPVDHHASGRVVPHSPAPVAAETGDGFASRMHVPNTASRRDRDLTRTVLALSLVCACGLLVVSAAFALSRSGRPFAELVYWAGLVVLFVPAAVWLTSRAPTRSQRLFLVVVVGMALYLVKVAHDPFQFAFSDDLVHAYNADEIARTGSLFHDNPILRVTPQYPGLETVTAALASLSGVSTFVAGTIVVGAARLMLMLALFLLFEAVGGSARVASLAAVLYAANPNFLYFDAQFSYESLALPLVVVVLYGLVRWMRTPTSRGEFLGIGALCLMTLAIVMTHHMSSYALTAFALALVVVHLILRRRREARRSIAFAAFTVACIIAWLVVVAPGTVGYLDPVFTKAFTDTVRTISNEGSPRELFSSANGGLRQPPWDRFLGLSSAVVIALSVPLGIGLMWRDCRKRPFALLLMLAAAGYVGFLGLRLVPGAWEVGSRASEFLFLGTAFVLANAILEWRRAARGARRLMAGSRLSGFAPVARALPGLAPPLRRLAPPTAISLVIAIVFTGGVVAGRPDDLRLAQPFAVDADGVTIKPPESALADWARSELGPGHRVAADASNARMLLVYGGQRPLTGKHPDVRDVIRGSSLRPWQIRLLGDEAIGYVVVDRRRISDAASRGYFFCPPNCALFPRVSARKFNHKPGTSRLFAGGHLTVYDVRSLWNGGGTR